MKGRSLELYFVDGKPDGMLTAEVFNWTGHVLKIPRTRIVEGLGRPEANYTGVYILLGTDDGEPIIYVGEAETLGERLRQHVQKKDWWDDAIVITTAGDALHKAHVKFLESRLVEIALSVGKAKVENGNTPTRSSLNEAAAANMESFLETLMMVLPAIRVDQFDEKRRQKPTEVQHTPVTQSGHFTLTLPRHDLVATARLASGEMIVEAGSQARPGWIGKSQERNSYFKFHAALLASGVIEKTQDGAVFTEDYAFPSPSAAAAVVCGRAANGRTSWLLTGTKTTYAEWELAQTQEPTP